MVVVPASSIATVCSAVHVFALARFRPARTAPVVGEMVSVELVALTDDTAPLPELDVPHEKALLAVV